jgi:hypothetical protein
MLAGMGELVAMTVWREARAARDRIALERTMHPSLRWVAGDQWWQAHTRDGAKASCGVEGALVLAPPGVPLCPDCYPQGAVSGDPNP